MNLAANAVHAVLLGSMLTLTGCSTQRVPDEQHKFRAGAPSIDPDRRSGRIYISAQPSPEALREFADMGGTTVVNLRSASEMETYVGFHEDRLAHQLGLDYVHVPIGASTMTRADVDRVSDAIGATQGPVLMHCASGTRASGMLAAHLANREGMALGEAIHVATPLGLDDRRSMVGAVMRVMLDEVDQVTADISPERLRTDVDTLCDFETRHTLSDTESETRGIGAARRWLKSEFEAIARESGRTGDEAMRVWFDTHRVEPDGRRIPRPVDIVNVVCEIPGSMPEARDRLYYVIAHYDSRNLDIMDSEGLAPGADDDASGVALCLELARVLSKRRLDATVVLMPVAGEEQGLYGSRLHAKALAEAGRNVAACLSSDVVGDPSGPDGREARDQIRLFSEGLPAHLFQDDPDAIGKLASIRRYATESDSPSRQIARVIDEVAQIHDLPVKPMLVYRPDRFLRGGDHTGFNEAGLPAVRFCEVYETYERQHENVRTEGDVHYGDTREYVDEHYLADVTRLNAAALVHLANAPRSPEDVRILIAGLSNDTTLRWSPVPEPDVAGYEIVWRETTSPVWQHSKDVGNVTEATVDLSKDNWAFGLRAYDRDGYRSPVSIPRAARE
ncbi:MAG: M20/M25/M40 family metallo-hydrolase [Phycisphaerales bacterium JB059]